MKLHRRDFMFSLAGASAAALLQPTLSRAESTIPAPLFIDARGKLLPISSSPIHLGGKRQTPQGEETLRVTNLYWERSLRTPDGQQNTTPLLPVSGEFHFSRYLPELWEPELRKMKACGLTVVATYLFWIFHEPDEGRFDWAGRRDLRRFLTLCHEVGMEVFLRIGPYVHGEIRNGGLPDWLYAKPFPVRSNDTAYLDCVRRFYDEIGRQVKGLCWSEGGPIVAIQIENEFMSASSPWEITRTDSQPIEWITRGSGGAEHMLALKRMAIKAGLSSPVYTATAWGSPVPALEMLPTYGGYGFEPWSLDPQTHREAPSWTFTFRATQHSLTLEGKQTGGTGQVPFACCELGGGMQCFYLDRFVVPADSVQATAVVALGSGCSFLGYYVFHGGSNPSDERVYYGEYDVPRISYDFQAPIRENGQVAESYRALRMVHLFLDSWSSRLATMQTVLPVGAEKLLPEEFATFRSALRTDGSEGFLFLNNYQDHVAQPERRNVAFHLQMDHAEVRVPSACSFSLASGESAILPVNLALGKLTLEWSTAQLLTEIQHEEERHIFLFSPRGIQPAMHLRADALGNCTAVNAEVERGASGCTIKSAADKPAHIRCHTGEQTTVLHILPRADALRLSRHRLWGEDRLVLTSADAAEKDGRLLLWSQSPQVIAEVFPPVAGATTSTSSALPGATLIHASALPWKGGIKTDRLAEDIFRIRIGHDALDGIDNLLLRVDYVGDIGQAFAENKLIADNFANGVPWEIGLRQLSPPKHDWELILKVTPRTADSPVALDETVPAPERFSGKHVAAIHNVEAVPIYGFLLDGSEVHR